MGEHRLRGLRGRMAVYQVVHDGLPTEFPVLRSVDTFAGNLPQQLSSLVGREEVVEELAELVRSRRLVTLSGVGGVGKTRLALEVGAEVAGEFPDGVWMVELAPVDSASVPAAVATVLGVTPRRRHATHRHGVRCTCRAAAPLGDGQLRARPRRRRLGHRGGARPVPRGQGPRHLTRDGLALDGETVCTVAPLAVEGGVTSDSVTLFVERARAVRPDFGLQEHETVTAVTEICETVDGLPSGSSWRPLAWRR